MFPATSWTLLSEATLTGDPAGRRALAELCEKYRPPVVRYLRIRGFPEPEAEDLAQDLFAQMLEKRWWKRADPKRGRFRTFLLAVLQRMVFRQRERAKAQKYGGGLRYLSLDQMAEEEGWEPEAAGPEPCFDYEWAQRILSLACAQVAERWQKAGRERQFAVYRRFIPGGQAVPDYASVAAELGVTEVAARTAVSRLRDELGRALRFEIAATVRDPAEVEAEMAYLRDVLAHPDFRHPDRE